MHRRPRIGNARAGRAPSDGGRWRAPGPRLGARAGRRVSRCPFGAVEGASFKGASVEAPPPHPETAITARAASRRTGPIVSGVDEDGRAERDAAHQRLEVL